MNPVWLHRAQQKKQRNVAELIAKGRVTKVRLTNPSIEILFIGPQRILKQKLTIWTNRVIEIKLRELEVAQRCDIAKQV